jgi:sulfate adenylyltransferase subunit 2
VLPVDCIVTMTRDQPGRPLRSRSVRSSLRSIDKIEIVPLYFAAERRVVERDGLLLMVDDNRFRFEGEEVQTRKVRFRTLGCYPLSGAVESEAETIEGIVAEMLLTTTSERQGRIIDKDAGSASMEKKKQEGYF